MHQLRYIQAPHMQEGFDITRECYSELKRYDSSTFSKSSGWVQAAAAADAIPPRYHLWTTGLGTLSSRTWAGFFATVVRAMLDMLLHLHAPHSAAMSACFIAFLPLYFIPHGSNTSQSAKVRWRAKATRSHDFLRAPTCNFLRLVIPIRVFISNYGGGSS